METQYKYVVENIMITDRYIVFISAIWKVDFLLKCHDMGIVLLMSKALTQNLNICKN